MSIKFNLLNCPYCKTKLVDSTVRYSENIKYPCLECKKCHEYFFTKNRYKQLYELAKKENRKLSSKVHHYNPETSIWSKKSATEANNKKKTTKTPVTKSEKNKSKRKHKNRAIRKKLSDKVGKPKVAVDINIVKDCRYFKNKLCTYFNESCNPYSVRCKNPNILLPKSGSIASKAGATPQYKKEETSKVNTVKMQYIKTVVLSNNRKCVYEEHNLIDIEAIIKVLTLDNKVIDVKVSAAHCKECNQYIILKTDFKSIKQKGTLLCRVIDATPEYTAKHKKSSYSGTESRVHALGYNVIKQGYNYTFVQRKFILANIMENYGITQHEILSMLDTNIARKINLSNYADAVEKWQQDREFVANYELGDCPEVVIDEVVIGKR